MAKRKKKKQADLTQLIIKGVIIALAILTICTLFMPLLSRQSSSLGKEFVTDCKIKGSDVFTGLFNSEIDSAYSDGGNALIHIKTQEGCGFVTNMFMILYLIMIIVAFAVIVFNVLSMLKINFKKLNIILGASLVVIAIATFIFAIIVASKMTIIDWGLFDLGISVLKDFKGIISVGTYMLIGTLICGGMHAYIYRKD